MKIILFALLGLIITNSHAYNPSCSKVGTNVVFVNGMFLSPTKTQKSLEAIEERSNALDKKIDTNENYPVEYEWKTIQRYKDDENLEFAELRDRLENIIVSIKARIRLETGAQISDEKAFEIFVYVLEVGIIITNPEALPLIIAAEAVHKYKENQFQDFLTSNSTKNLLELTELYRTRLLDNKRLLIVTHGEGSRTSDLAISYTFDRNYVTTKDVPSSLKKDFISSAHIAPATGLYYKGTHRNYEWDTYFFFSLPDLSFSPINIRYSPPPAGSDKWNHSFLTTYMADGVRGLEDSDIPYYGTLGGIVEAAEELSSECDKPIAKIKAIKSSEDVLSYVFDASDSEDLNDDELKAPAGSEKSDIVRFKWEVNCVDKEFHGPLLKCSFIAPGKYDVTLKVTDRAGNESEKVSLALSVGSIKPIANFSSSINNLTVNLDASNSNDEDGTIELYTWKFFNSNGSILGTSSSADSAFSYTFQEAGNYDVELIVKDNSGLSSDPVRKTISVSSASCYDPLGNLYPGKIYFNANGTLGGYVANTATIIGNVVMTPNSFVCGTSRLEGNVTIYDSTVIDSNISGNNDGLVSDGTYVFNSRAVGVTLSGYRTGLIMTKANNSVYSGVNIRTENSEVQKSQLQGNNMNIVGSKLSNSSVTTTQASASVRITSSNINSDIISTKSAIVIIFSTVNSPITGWTINIDWSTINSPLNTSCVQYSNNFASPLIGTQYPQCPQQ